MKRILAICLLTFGLVNSTVAQARDLTVGEREALTDRVSSFVTAMAAKDISEVISVMPPRILQHIAKQAGAEVDAFRELVISQTTQAMKDVVFEKAEMPIDKAEYKTTPTGEPYALIPTTFVMNSEATGKMEASSHTLALLDQGTWYLMRVNDPGQLAILRKVYPGFTGIEFPRGTIKAIK